MIGDGDATNAIEIPPTYVKDFSGTGTLKNIKKISGSWTSLCALSMIGEVYCWGPNDYGQVGDPSLPVGTSALIPHKVALPGPAVQVAAGWSLNCALLANNNVYCWGRNILGAMGLDPVTGLRYPNAVYQTPVLVGGI
jgi:alpha-tubulin suppressor-like RCC1 family protein